MNELIQKFLAKSGVELKARRPYFDSDPDGYLESDNDFIQNNHEAIIKLIEGDGLKKFTELIVQCCINKIETYQIPVGNSAAGEMACEWTYDALKEIRDDIKQKFGISE